MTFKKKHIELSSEQKAAVEHIGPALVVAGAGSGKTRTLTAKIAYLIDQGCASDRILAITFTNKAADEMKRRLTGLTGLTIGRFPWVRTFHSACFRILKQHGHVLGYQSPIQIYSDYQQQKLFKEILAGLNIDKKYFYPVLYQISHAKNSGNPYLYFDTHKENFHFRLTDIFDIYEKSLFARNAVDFDNILLKTRDLLRDYSEIRNQYRHLFLYVLVDEYQDTNNLQEDLTRFLVKNGNLFCVGDDWQAIYGFRGSNVNHFLKFTDNYKEAKIFRLERNYRSVEEIVHAANGLISHNAKRMEKSCYSKKTDGVIEMHDFFSDDEEAGWVADKIVSLHHEDIAYDKIAVLYRTKFCSLPFEQVFRSTGIPYQMLGSKGFFERKEVLDITCYLTAAVFEKDGAAFERIVNTPRRGIGPGTLKKIRQAGGNDLGLQDAVRFGLKNKVVIGKAYDGLSCVINLLKAIRSKSPVAAINEILEKTKYFEYLKKYSRTNEDYISRQENIEQLMYSASHHDAIVDYLEEASLIKEDREENEEPDRKVSLSTMHASKGLEYQVVFVVGCEENLLPHWKSLESDVEIEEERRLMYVAMTRAEQNLYLLSTDYRKGQYNLPSRFLSEISQYY